MNEILLKDGDRVVFFCFGVGVYFFLTLAPLMDARFWKKKRVRAVRTCYDAVLFTAER